MKKIYNGGIKIVFLFLIFLIIIISAIIFSYGNSVQNVPDNVREKTQKIVAQSKEKTIDQGKKVVGETLKETGEKLLDENTDQGVYVKFGEVSLKDFSQTIFFFTDPDCADCQKIEQDIDAHRADIPANVAIVRADLQENRQLQEKYHVTKAHTFVFVDSNGNEIAQWTDINTFQDLLNHIQ